MYRPHDVDEGTKGYGPSCTHDGSGTTGIHFVFQVSYADAVKDIDYKQERA